MRWTNLLVLVCLALVLVDAKKKGKGKPKPSVKGACALKGPKPSPKLFAKYTEPKSSRVKFTIPFHVFICLLPRMPVLVGHH